MEDVTFTITKRAVVQMTDAEMEAALERISPEVRARIGRSVNAYIDILTRALLTPLPQAAPLVFEYVSPRSLGWHNGWRFIDPDWTAITIA